MSKKCTKDAFYFYKLKFEEENQGKIFYRGIVDVDIAARQAWRSMTLQQRDPYEDLAKQAAPVQQNPPKVDPKALPENSIEAKNKKIVKEIVRRSVLSHTIRTDEYYFIAANIFCETDSNEYIPAEIALLKFTLQDGVTRMYHTHINPETIPKGYRFIALDRSETTHRLPLPPKAMGEKNFASIQQAINQFIGNARGFKEGKQTFIPLFTLAENVRMIESICEELHASTSEATICRYKVLPIDELLFRLKTSVGRNIGGGVQQMASGMGWAQFNSVDDVTSQLNREKYKFMCEIACMFHDELDCSKYCCLADVRRWAYVCLENLCPDLKISLVAGKHFPMGVEAPVPPAPAVSVDQKCAPIEFKATGAEATTHRKSNCNGEDDPDINLTSLQLVDGKCPSNVSTAATTTAAPVHSKSNCDRKYNLNVNLDSQGEKLGSSAAQSFPAKGNRRQRNYFAEDDLVRRSFGKGKGKGIRRG